MRLSDGETLLLKLQRLLVLPLKVMKLSKQVEAESFRAFLSSLPADPQRFFNPVSGLVEFAGHGVDLGDDEETRRQDVLLADLRGERLRLAREFQGLFELMGPEEARTDLVQGLRLRVPIPALSGHLQQTLMGFDRG